MAEAETWTGEPAVSQRASEFQNDELLLVGESKLLADLEPQETGESFPLPIVFRLDAESVRRRILADPGPRDQIVVPTSAAMLPRG